MLILFQLVFFWKFVHNCSKEYSIKFRLKYSHTWSVGMKNMYVQILLQPNK